MPPLYARRRISRDLHDRSQRSRLRFGDRHRFAAFSFCDPDGDRILDFLQLSIPSTRLFPENDSAD
jgi:hypothetical protein